MDEGEETVRRLLVDSSGEIDATDDAGMTLLHHAVLRGNAPVVRLLLANGARHDLRDRQHRTPLIAAAEAWHPECVYLLLSAGADPNVTVPPVNDATLHKAVSKSSPEIVRLLVSAGANPNARNAWGKTPLHVAAEIEWLRSVAVARELLDAGADIAARDDRGYQAIHVAATRDDVPLIRLLHERGGKLDELTTGGRTAFELAIQLRQDRAAHTLWTLGAKTDSPRGGLPPLHRAARLNDIERVEVLLAFDPDHTRRYEGKTALELARESHSEEVVALLSRHRGPK